MKQHMECTFERMKNVNIPIWSGIVYKLEYDLMLLCSGKIPYEEVRHYIGVLAQKATVEERNPKMASFGIAKCHELPSDAMVDFFFRPTYYAASIMAKAVLMYPELLELRIGTRAGETLSDVLSKVLLCCTDIEFCGHGYDAISALLDTLDIFGQADMYDFVAKYPEICPEFTKLYKGTLEDLKPCLHGEKLTGAWGEDYTERVKEVLENNVIAAE